MIRLSLEKELLIIIEQYPQAIENAGNEMDPSIIANYAYQLAKTFNSFYTEHSIVNAETEEKKELRLMIAQMTANIISSAFGMLGIKVPERM